MNKLITVVLAAGLIVSTTALAQNTLPQYTPEQRQQIDSITRQEEALEKEYNAKIKSASPTQKEKYIEQYETEQRQLQMQMMTITNPEMAARMKSMQPAMDSAQQQQRAMQEKLAHMSPAQRNQYTQTLMHSADAMKKCIDDIWTPKDRQEMQARAARQQAQLKALCAAGQITDAEASLKKYIQEMMDDPHIKKSEACRQEWAQQSGMPAPEPFTISLPKKGANVCDEYKK